MLKTLISKALFWMSHLYIFSSIRWEDPIIILTHKSQLIIQVSSRNHTILGNGERNLKWEPSWKVYRYNSHWNKLLACDLRWCRKSDVDFYSLSNKRLYDLSKLQQYWLKFFPEKIIHFMKGQLCIYIYIYIYNVDIYVSSDDRVWGVLNNSATRTGQRASRDAHRKANSHFPLQI